MWEREKNFSHVVETKRVSLPSNKTYLYFSAVIHVKMAENTEEKILTILTKSKQNPTQDPCFAYLMCCCS